MNLLEYFPPLDPSRSAFDPRNGLGVHRLTSLNDSLRENPELLFCDAYPTSLAVKADCELIVSYSGQGFENPPSTSFEVRNILGIGKERKPIAIPAGLMIPMDNGLSAKDVLDQWSESPATLELIVWLEALRLVGSWDWAVPHKTVDTVRKLCELYWLFQEIDVFAGDTKDFNMQLTLHAKDPEKIQIIRVGDDDNESEDGERRQKNLF